MDRTRLIVLDFAAATLGRSVAIRAFCLRCAGIAGYLRQRLSRGLPRMLLLYALAAAVVTTHAVLTAPDSLRRWDAFRARPAILFDRAVLFQGLRWFLHGIEGPWAIALVLAAIMAATLAAWTMRQRIVIVSFGNLTGDPAQQSLADSLARRLMTELSETTDVYQHVSLDPADLSIESDSRRLALAVNPAAGAFSGLTASMKGQNVKLGPFSIPLEWTVTTFSTLLRGPQIGGSVQKSGTGLLLEAAISGGGYDQTWRIHESDVQADRTGGEEEARIVDRMVAQLGHRIFTDLNRDEIGTQNWRAGEHYTAGLRSFRQAQRAHGNAAQEAVALRNAEQQFLLAYREDRTFLRSRYNLGVINSYQGAQEAAYAVFEEVINDPTSWTSSGLPGRRRFIRDREDLARTHYVAAVQAWSLAHRQKSPSVAPPEVGSRSANGPWVDRADYHCDMALSIQPWNASAARMKADIRHGHHGAGLWARRACAISWWKLCDGVWANQVRAIDLWDAVSHVSKLGLEERNYPAAIRSLKQALRLQPENARGWLQLGCRHVELRDYRNALQAFDAANRESERAIHWVWIACTRHISGSHPEPTQSAWERVLEILDADPDQIREVVDFWMKKSPFEREQLAAWREDTSYRFDRYKAITRMRRHIPMRGIELSEEGRKAFSSFGVDPGKPEEVLAWLLKDYDQNPEVRYLSSAVLNWLLPRLLADPTNSNERTSTVVRLVQAMVRDRPTDSVARYNLAYLYFLCGLTDQAASEAVNAVSLSTDRQDDPDLLINMAWKRFLTLPDKRARRDAMREVFAVYRDLADSATAGVWKLDPDWAGSIHFVLARAAFELLDFKTAQQSFEIAFACNCKRAECLQMLCVVYYRCGAFEEAETAYRRLQELLPDPSKRTPDETRQLGAAANHTAAAMAEQGLVAQAWVRWSEGKQLLQSLRSVPVPVEWMRWDPPAHALCKGVILLAAAMSPNSLAKLTAPSPELKKTDKELFEAAIQSLTEAFEDPIDVAIRADALYRIALACGELSRLDGDSAETWRRRAIDALRGAEEADRRGEYVDRIDALRKKIEGSVAVGRPSAEIQAATSAKSGT